ncbi:hypothetical protein CspeluHIS016_0800840 [Cutaneotrichosporon spelunceum]|uniref:DASH complex subunit DAM1 n=1 Tax=Cutaneotrichosporon spelunceum TaxID=1672016 RepID=A0AAD3TZ85_9TREE|nr:hypothetical protein CspeluHIS016_0800840 [Cutaneotrichosporon spelunceum]
MSQHPLRRISTGSLSSLARSQGPSSSGLDWLEPALINLADEAATLSANIGRLNEMHTALDKFNEGFAAYLYALKINAFCVEWNEGPDGNSWRRLEELSAPEPKPKPEAETKPEPKQGDLASSSRSLPSSPNAGNNTYETIASFSPEHSRALGAKKRREVEISRIIDTQLPLEYRGSDADMRLVMEKVIDKLIDADEGLLITDMLSSQTLLRPRVYKALIALVAKKLVTKTSDKVDRFMW